AALERDPQVITRSLGQLDVRGLEAGTADMQMTPVVTRRARQLEVTVAIRANPNERHRVVIERMRETHEPGPVVRDEQNRSRDAGTFGIDDAPRQVDGFAEHDEDVGLAGAGLD